MKNGILCILFVLLFGRASFAGGPTVYISGKSNDTICLGTMIHLYGTIGGYGDEYYWSIGPSAIISPSFYSQSVDISFPTAGVYFIMLKGYDDAGRPGSAYKTVTVLSSPCKDTLNVVTDSVTTDSTHINPNTQNNISFYPNPTNGEINFKNLEDNLNYELLILNSRGENLLHSTIINQQSIYLNSESGIYFYKILDEHGNQSSGKFLLIK